MRNLTYYIISCIVCSFYFYSCNANQESKHNEDTVLSSSIKDTIQIKRGKEWGFRVNDVYPKIIDSLQLRELYDSTRWYLYLLHTGEKPIMLDSESDKKIQLNVTFNSLELRFDTLEVFKDTLKLYFCFYVNDTLALDMENFYGLEEPINGRMYFDSKDPYFCYMRKGSSIEYSCTKLESRNSVTIDKQYNRRINPLQPEIIQYINKHKDELHPWFYREAVKRGVIKEE
ncbi:MAG: hypothetical protein KL787_03600 [Taibaiella sp.]|nr:hypothetical protein [Taibaiella sp.]